MALSRIFVAPKNGQGGVKKSKKIFFSKKNIRKMGKKNFGTSGTIFGQNRFWGSGGWGVRSTVTSQAHIGKSRFNLGTLERPGSQNLTSLRIWVQKS